MPRETLYGVVWCRISFRVNSTNCKRNFLL